MKESIMTEQKSKFEVLQEKISAQVGPPVFENGEKEKAYLNQQFFARLAAAVYKLIFEKTEGAFYLYVPESGLWVRQDDASMIDRVSLLMMEFANEMENSDIAAIVLISVLSGVYLGFRLDIRLKPAIVSIRTHNTSNKTVQFKRNRVLFPSRTTKRRKNDGNGIVFYSS